MDALKERLPPGSFRDKIVIIGESLVDSYPVPTSTSRRGSMAEIVAEAVQTILTGRFLHPMPLAQGATGVWVLGLIGALVFGWLRPLRAALTLLGVLGLYLAYTTWLYRSGTFPDLVLAPGALLAASLLTGGSRYAREEVARRHITDLFGRYLPRTVVADLVRKPLQEALTLGGVRREVTVLFADVRGFTAFSEGLPPEDVLAHLNALLRGMVDCVFRYEGTVDKYLVVLV